VHAASNAVKCRALLLSTAARQVRPHISCQTVWCLRSCTRGNCRWCCNMSHALHNLLYFKSSVTCCRTAEFNRPQLTALTPWNHHCCCCFIFTGACSTRRCRQQLSPTEAAEAVAADAVSAAATIGWSHGQAMGYKHMRPAGRQLDVSRLAGSCSRCLDWKRVGIRNQSGIQL
jgi:hypothetical protein